MQARASRLLFFNVSRILSHLQEPMARFSTISSRPMSAGYGGRGDPSEDEFLRDLSFGDGVDKGGILRGTHPDDRAPLQGRPLRGGQRPPELLNRAERSGGAPIVLFPNLDGENRIPNRPVRGERQQLDGGDEGLEGWSGLPVKVGDQLEKHTSPEKRDAHFSDTFFQKMKLGVAGSDAKGEGADRDPLTQIPGSGSAVPEPPAENAGSAVPEPPAENADEIFKKMKESGFIPSTVAMLDGLCRDGLVEESMKLFAFMREKGTVPEVVVYTAAVEGYCKAAKFDEAKRIFRKMQSNGVVPNAYSYTVLIQGLCRGRRLEDSVEVCREMLGAGHLPNAATFVILVDGFCQEKGLEEAENFVKSLRELGYPVDEKSIKEYLDKKGPFSQMVWDAIFGKKKPHRPF